MLDMANDSGLFRSRGQLEAEGFKLNGNQFKKVQETWLPLLEAKMVYLWNHRFGDFALLAPGEREHILPQAADDALQRPDYLTMPRYWINESEVASRLQSVWSRNWLLGWRDVTDSRSSVRTVVVSLVPRLAVGHKFPLMMPSAAPSLAACFYASLCSFVLDYAARQKVGGVSLTYFILKQLPVLKPQTYDAKAPWSPNLSLAEWMVPRVVELSYTSWDLEGFANDVGFEGPPFRWDSERRALLRAELDAAFFHLYGVSREDADYVLETFPIVRKNDEKRFGDYRTKRLIIERYDALAAASRSGKYVTPLDPPPAHESMRHPPRERRGAGERQPSSIAVTGKPTREANAQPSARGKRTSRSKRGRSQKGTA